MTLEQPPKSFLGRLKKIPRGVWALGFVSMLMDISSELIHALLPIYLVTVMGASMTQVGIIEGIAEATASIVKVFSGAISDWFGKRKLLALIGYGMAALTKPIFPLATSIEWIVAARFVDRVGKGIRGAPRDALVADISPPEIRGASFGLRQSLDTVGAFLGPILAILIMLFTANSFQLVFWVAFFPACLAVWLLVSFVKEPQRPDARGWIKFPLHVSELRKLSVHYWVVVAISGVFTLARFSEAFLVLKAQGDGIPTFLIPVVLVVMNVAYAVTAYPIGAVSDRVNRLTLLNLGLILLIIADIVLAFSSTIYFTLIGVALWGVHMGATQGILAALVADTAPVELRGTAFGFFNLLQGIALLLASLCAGLIWDHFGGSTTFIVGAIFAAISVVLVQLVRLKFDELGKLQR